jgi:hypothetical protein
MRTRITLRRLLVLATVALVALTVVSACGGDDKDKGNGGTPTADLATPPTGGTPGHEGDIGGATNDDGTSIPAAATPRPHDDPSYRSTAEASNEATDEAEEAAEDAAEETEEAGEVDNEPPGN